MFQCIGVVSFVGLLRFDGGHARARIVFSQLLYCSGKIVEIGRHDGDLQVFIEEKRVLQLDDLLLQWRPLLFVGLICQAGLIPDFRSSAA